MNMRRAINIGLLAATSVALTTVFGCAANDVVNPPMPVGRTVWVSPLVGEDIPNAGTENMPYRTITFALTQITPDKVSFIELTDGTYNKSSGEVFPVVIESAFTLTASEADSVLIGDVESYTSSSTGSVINATLVFEGCSSCGISGRNKNISVEGLADGVGVWCEGSDARIDDVTISGYVQGIVCVGDGRPTISQCDIVDNLATGIETQQSTSPRVRRCLLTGNDVGVLVLPASRPDLGTEYDPGGNVLAGNVRTDVCNRTSSTIFALGNEWDEDPFLFSRSDFCGNGNNVADELGGTVVYQTLPADNLLFPKAVPIELTSPVVLDTMPVQIPDGEPNLIWETSGQKLEIVVVFAVPIRQIGGRITNSQDALWAWHTGLSSGSQGNVAFDDGVAVVGGELTSQRAESLRSGRTYYWAVWAWDDSGREITNSSRIGYFTVSS